MSLLPCTPLYLGIRIQSSREGQQLTFTMGLKEREINREGERECLRMERRRESRATHKPFRGQLLKIPPPLPNKR
jgi:hypothetical protein